MSDEPTDGTPSNNSADKKPEELLGSGEKSQTVTDVSERQNLVDVVQSLVDRIESVENENEALRDENEALRDRLVKMESEHSSLNNTVDRFQQTVEELRGEVDRLRDMNDSLEKKTGAVNRKVDHLRSDDVLGVENEDGNIDIDTPLNERLDNLENEMHTVDSLGKPIDEFSKIEIAEHFALDAVYRDAKAKNGKGQDKGSVTVSTVIGILESRIVKNRTNTSMTRQTVHTAFQRARANWDGISIQSGTPGRGGKQKQLRCDLENVDPQLDDQINLFMDQLDISRDELA